MKWKSILIFLIIGLNFICVLCSDCIEWSEHLKNPQKTAYSPCNGPETPEILWKVSTSGSFHAPFIMDGKVLILWKDSWYHPLTGKVILLDVFTGEVLHDKDGLFSQVFFVNGKIVGRTGKSLYEINMAEKTSTFLTEIPDRPYAINQYPVIFENKIIIPTYPPLCFTFDYDIMWDMENTKLDPNLELYNLAGDETILGFIAAEEGVTKLITVNPSTGTLKWMSDPLPLSLWLTSGGDTIYCGGEKLWAFDKNGSEKWRFSPEKRIMSNLVLGPKAVYCADEANNLYKIDLCGNLVWKKYWEASPWYYETHLVGGGDILYCIGNYGDPDFPSRSSITAYTMEDGSESWNLEFVSPAHIRGAPAVVNGILVFGTAGGDIMAVASDPDIFVKQGDTFVEMGNDKKAAESYKKALELCEKKGLTEKYQKILEHVVQRGFTQFGTPEPPQTSPPESTPPDTSPPITEPSQSPPAGPEPSRMPEYLIVVVGIIIGILLLYMWKKHK
ncbi:MAG: PQQ-binding-like beta-propeller repeat protein [Candidatus Methanofastidiosia archaeon]